MNRFYDEGMRRCGHMTVKTRSHGRQRTQVSHKIRCTDNFESRPRISQLIASKFGYMILVISNTYWS